MDSQLQKHTLFEILRTTQSLESGIRVQTEGLNIKMAVEGYIPMPTEDLFGATSTILFEGNFNGDIKKDFIIGSDRIRFSNQSSINNQYYKSSTIPKVNTYPITRHIVVTKEAYKLTNALTIFKYFDNSLINTYKKNYQNNKNDEKALNNILGISEKQFERKKDGIYYKSGADEFAMYRFKERSNCPLAISNNFVCLCSYINTITGKIDYILYNPEELIQVL